METESLANDLASALMQGARVYIVIEDSFFKGSLSGDNLKLSFIPMTTEEVLSEIKRRANEEV